MSVSLWQDQNALSIKNKLNSDIVIIGAGIAGFSTAYWLLKEDPQLKIVVLDKYSMGAGASGRNAGFITCGSVEHFNRMVSHHGSVKAQAIWSFSEKNLELLKEEIIDPSKNDLMFEEKGSFSLASTLEELKQLKKSAELMKQMNIAVEVITKNNIEARLGVQGFTGGIKYLQDASIHPMQLVAEIKKRCSVFSGFQLLEKNEVFHMENKNDEVTINTNEYVITSNIAIMATNGYSSLLDNYFKDKIFPTRGQILATEPVARFMEGPCYANFVLDYFRQLSTGELVIGGFRQLQKDTEVGFSDETSDIIQKALEDFIKKHIPKISKAKITHRWSGVMGFSADGQPMIGSLPSQNQVFFIGGFTAHGLGLAFHTAKCLVDLIYAREIPKFINAKRF
ncbi:MAG: FAD-dependent oxidoreductase [Halobacteriovoraceae bacterium]|nr:FAD-dependent oxidoreductase [Halobacteriovoraceae bacterium]|tara:strand:- start:31598 stop:32782 length:1185 start_codon:yes stop_codon:yes gene_type:complete